MIDIKTRLLIFLAIILSLVVIAVSGVFAWHLIEKNPHLPSAPASPFTLQGNIISKG